MATRFNDMVNRALQLSPQERCKLVHHLIVSLEGVSDDSPEAIAKAWDEEVARRVAEMEAGRTHWILADEVMSRISALISATKAAHAD
jgi:putative addiction module component (TIGR02574 family)